MNEIKFEIRAHKQKSFGPQYLATRKETKISSGMSLHNVTKNLKGTFVVFGSISIPPTFKSIDTTSMP